MENPEEWVIDPEAALHVAITGDKWSLWKAFNWRLTKEGYIYWARKLDTGITYSDRLRIVEMIKEHSHGQDN